MHGHHHPKLSIKVPKLLVVTKMRRNEWHFHIKGNATAIDKDTGSTRPKRGNQFPRKLVGPIFSGVLGNKGPQVKFPSNGKKNESNGDKGDGREWHNTEKAMSRELGNNLVCGDEPIGAALSQLIALEETLEHEGGTGEGKKNRKDKKRVRKNHRLLSFLDERKKGWNNFIKAKIRRNRFNGEVHVHGDGDGNGVVTRFGQARTRKASLWRLVRIPSRILVVRLKLKMIKSLMTKKKVTKQCELGGGENGHEDRGVSELCKKRILMGARCKPLSSSGTLRYDKDGLHLPEIVP